MEFDAVSDMNAIDGVIADLAARTNRPQGYPFSKVTVYSVCPEIEAFMPHFYHVPAIEVPSMRKLDFKKAGKVFGAKVQEMKNDLTSVPEEFIITASRFDPVDEPKRKTTGCRKYLIEVETDDCSERWSAILFRKALKKYVTEDMEINIVPPIFGDKYPEPNDPCVARVTITLGNCTEKLYQALEMFGHDEFADLPIRLRIPSRAYIAAHPEELGTHYVAHDGEKAWFRMDVE
jgi:hypothetical protein